MEAIAKTKYLKGSPRKTRLVIDMIRGVNVSRALAILKFTDKRAAQPIEKTLRSAIANATYLAEQQNIAIDPDDLWVKTCFVDMGPTKHRRRMRPAPQGRAYREQRHYCHITIQVTSDAKAADEKDRRKAVKAETEAPAVEASAEKKPKAPAKKAAKKPAEGGEKAGTKKKAAPKKETTGAKVEKQVEAQERKSDADAADVKNVSSQRTAEMHETKPADEAQERINEELERQ